MARTFLDPAHFIHEHCWIRAAEGGLPIRFRLWDAQREVLRDFLTYDRSIVLKARQLGLSWTALGFALWLTACNRGQTVLILNRNQQAAGELLARVKFMMRHLPDWLRPRVTKSNTTELEFGDLDSRIISLPCTEYSGTGLTATLIILDEWAKLRWTEELWASILPTISAGGRFIGISTAVGYHNQFARMWRAAVAGVNELHPIFLPWHAHPNRDDDWYARERADYLAASASRHSSERLFEREFPEVEGQAFATTGMEVFSDEWDSLRHTWAGDPLPHGWEQWPVIRGVDFGYHHSPVLWARLEQDRTVVVWHELAAERGTTHELARDMAAYDTAIGAPAPWVCGVDPAGAARTSHGDPDTTILEAAGYRVDYERWDPAARVRLIKELLRTNRLRIHASCVRLIEAIERAEWDRPRQSMDAPPRDTYSKDGLYEHPLDCLGYLLICLVPEHAPADGGAGQGWTRAREYAAVDGGRY